MQHNGEHASLPFFVVVKTLIEDTHHFLCMCVRKINVQIGSVCLIVPRVALSVTLKILSYCLIVFFCLLEEGNQEKIEVQRNWFHERCLRKSFIDPADHL